MGAWGFGVFENDDALDWAADLVEVEDTSFLAESFDAIPMDSGEYVEAPEASMALAAAEVVAALLGKALPQLPEEVTGWIAERKRVKPALVSKARRAVQRILADSELRELWQDCADFAQWQDSVQGLLRRLASSPA